MEIRCTYGDKMQEKITIIMPIYKSVEYLKFVTNSLKEHTPEEHEFLVIANGATKEVIDYLIENNYNWITNEEYNKDKHYLVNVYIAYNEGIKKAKGDIIVMINSDMAFSKDWLSNLLKHLKKDNIISSRLIEAGKMPSGVHGISKSFGNHPLQFKREVFESFAEQIKVKDHKTPWGMFAPIAYYKETIMKFDGYPHGNIYIDYYGKPLNIPGDVYIFALMASKGILLYTSFDSIVYHFQEGETREEEDLDGTKENR